MDYYWFLCSLMLITDFNYGTSLFVTHLNVPEIVDFRDNVTLSCSYDIAGHTLNSVKWYKDKMEFFRYTPMMHPIYMKFTVIGVQVPDSRYHCNESLCRIELSLLGAKSTGVYKCEVSGDAPHFKLAAKADNMTVASLPQSNPLIESFNSMYHVDNFVSATCTSDFSSLPTRLTWYINGQEARADELESKSDTNIQAHGYIMRRQRLKIQFLLSGPRFYDVGKTLELKCSAEIENFSELRRETALSATLIHDDNLNNQMLIHSGLSGSTTIGNLRSDLVTYTAVTMLIILISTSVTRPSL